MVSSTEKQWKHILLVNKLLPNTTTIFFALKVETYRIVCLKKRLKICTWKAIHC
jgi:hypothetical protein